MTKLRDDTKRCNFVKSTGIRCGLAAEPNSDKCRFHGGRAPKGIAAASFKHGRYSKYMPTQLLKRYEDARDDPELLNLRDDIALVESRLTELVAHVTTGESGSLWQKARELIGEARIAQLTGSVPDILAPMADLAELIRKGEADTVIWGEVVMLMEAKRRLIESERKRLVEMNQMVSAESAMTLIVALGMVVKKYVTDQHTLSRISEEFIRLARHDPSGNVETGSGVES